MCGARQTQDRVCARQTLPPITQLLFYFLILRQGFTELGRQALNLWSPCFSLLSSWYLWAYAIRSGSKKSRLYAFLEKYLGMRDSKNIFFPVCTHTYIHTHLNTSDTKCVGVFPHLVESHTPSECPMGQFSYCLEEASDSEGSVPQPVYPTSDLVGHFQASSCDLCF